MTTDGWIEKELGEVLRLNYGWSLPEKKRVTGDFPVYGSNGVVGSHNKALVPAEGIVVGRKGSAGSVHLAPKPFCPIDTTFYIAPSDTSLDLEFLYFLLQHIDLKRILGDVGVPGLSREMAYKERVEFPTDRDEQRKIAGVLGLVQWVIEQQERLLQLTTELKKTLLHQLFTQGLRGEPQKQTEIGPVPESWEGVSVGSLVDIAHGYAFASPHFTTSGPIVLTPGNFKLDGGLYWGDRTKFTTEKYAEEYVLHPQDLVVVMTDLTPSAKLLGTPAFIPDNKVILHNQRIGKIVLKSSKTMPEFLYWVFLTAPFKKHMAQTATGSTVRHTSPSRIKDYKFALPSIDEQEEMANSLNMVDRKLQLVEVKRSALMDLFRTLLHQLMTAQIRVHDLDLPELNWNEQ
ncbi:MAG: restriction endonuclease subunit S [Pyrinomonadaceae bacterium]